jgi:serine/threonine-protein kinase
MSRLAGFTIVARLSHADAPADVSLARDAAGQPCVLKRLRAEYADREDLALRLRLEGAIIAELGGRGGLVRALEVVDTPNEPYTIVLEHIPGGSLADRLRDTPVLDLATATRVAAELFGALAHLHAHDVVHRDVKPSNILFDAAGALRLIDLSVAARGRPPRALPEDWEEERVGTLRYTAPEALARGAPIAAAQDIYSAGVVFREMLGGHPPPSVAPLIASAMDSDAGKRPPAAALASRISAVGRFS